MGVTCGIVGLPNIGKTTIFNAMTGAGAERTTYASTSAEPNVAELDVPDARLGVIEGFIETKKVVHAKVKVVDIAGLAEGASRGVGIGNAFLGHIKETDALMHVVQCFESPQVSRERPIDPSADMDVLELELAAADFETVLRNVERVAKKARAGDKEAIAEKEIFERAKALLEDGVQLRTVDWKDAERDALRPLFLLTLKPMLYVANVADDDQAGEGEWAQAVAKHAAEMQADWIPMCGDIECELSGMDDDDRAMFMEELGVTELARPRLVRRTYDLLGLQTYFTAGEMEIKAWTIRRGDTAPRAAGVIHTDFEKGFIRAEVYSVDDLSEHESEAAIKSAGKLRVEGKDYVMQEGDVVHFLFSK
ncbi:MAG: redox-regulated ATPase YchF [Planctomycetota bacterium]